MRYRDFIRGNPDMGERILSMRLKELEAEDYIDKYDEEDSVPTYRLTRKGDDVMPILAAFMQFGIRHYADRVFKDGQARELMDLYPVSQKRLAGRMVGYIEGQAPGRTRKPA